jgi:hypothetical protein
VAFRLAGAEAIPEPDASADVVFMFKSPHQVPRELFFLAPVHFNSFAAFESAVIGVSHTQHRLSPELYEQVRERFSRHLGPDGADFLQPVRVDLLRKPR